MYNKHDKLDDRNGWQPWDHEGTARDEPTTGLCAAVPSTASNQSAPTPPSPSGISMAMALTTSYRGLQRDGGNPWRWRRLGPWGRWGQGQPGRWGSATPGYLIFPFGQYTWTCHIIPGLQDTYRSSYFPCTPPSLPRTRPLPAPMAAPAPALPTPAPMSAPARPPAISPRRHW